jgi:anti-sigma B factor antagonist
MTMRIAAVGTDVWVIAPRGRLDLPAARALEDALNDLFDVGRAKVVVDLSEVPYVASAGLKALLSGLRRARLLNGDVRLAALDERVVEVFEMAGFDQLFVNYPLLDAAVQSYSA